MQEAKKKRLIILKFFQNIFFKISGIEVNPIAKNIQNHQWKQTPATRPLPSLPNAGQYDKKGRFSLAYKIIYVKF